MNKNIGFIGLGAMGKPMAMNLLKAGMKLICYNRSKEPVKELVELGAGEGLSCADVATRSDIIITVLPADKQILDVYTSEDGVLSSIRDGCVCIDMTSARGDTIKYVAQKAAQTEKSITVIDAPVSGGVQAAAEGTLTIMAGGEKEAVEKYTPLLQVLGKKIFYTGDIGSGKSVKMINQMLNACNTYIMSEALCLADDMGIDRDLLYNVVTESSGNSWVFKNNMPKFIFTQKFDQGFKLELMRKDLGLCIEQAMNDSMFLPVSNFVFQVYEAMNRKGKGKANYNIVSDWIFEQNHKNEE